MRWKGSCNLPWIIWVRVRSWFRDSFGWGVGFEEKRLPSHMEIILVLHGIHGEFHLPLPNPTPGSDDIAYHIDIYLLFRGHISNSSTGKVQGNETLISHNYMYVIRWLFYILPFHFEIGFFVCSQDCIMTKLKIQSNVCKINNLIQNTHHKWQNY